MKKLIFGILVLTMLLTIGYSQSITVSAPTAGETVDKADAYVIRWTSEGELPPTIKIRLFDRTGSSKVMDIADRVETAAGRFRCVAGFFNSVPDGSYVVLVRTSDNAYEDFSGVFILGSPGSDPDPDPDPEPDPEPEPGRDDCYSLSISQPRTDGTTSWFYRTSNEIRWMMRLFLPCDPPDNVRIELRNEANTSTVRTIATNTPNDGRHPWVIPDNTPIGNYKIRITTIGDNPFVVTSGAFHVGFVVLSTIPLDLRIIDLSGRITNRELKVAYLKGFRWRIKCKIRVSVIPERSSLTNVFVEWRLGKVGGTSRYSSSYTIGSLSGGAEHVKSINMECGDNKNKKRRPRLEEGDYFIRVTIDPNDRKKDRNLRNNTFEWRFTLKR